ncbi:MAG TPA: hypothetical protein VET90_07195, partial [Candidatus Binatus sp.]|nr:hypothetical protein [Candidatus Binatus sp.]
GAVGAMGLGTMLIHEMPRHPGREIGYIATSLLAAAVIGAGLGLAFVIVTPLLSGQFAPVRDSLVLAILVIDQALIGLLRSGVQLVRNVLAAVLRLILLAVLALGASNAAGVGMVAPWVLSTIASMAALGVYAGLRGQLRDAHPFDWRFLGQQWLPALQHHTLNLAIQLPGWAMPIVAVAALSARENGGFYLAWQLVGIAAFVQVSLTWILYAAAARDRSSLARWGWLTLRLSVVTAVASAAALWILGPLVLELFGRGYSDTGRQALVALPFTVLLGVVKAHYITVHRVLGTLSVAARLVAVAAVMEIAGGYVGASIGGLQGLGTGLVVAMAVEILPMIPIVYRQIVRPQLGVRWQPT